MREVDVDKGALVGRNDEAAQRELPEGVHSEDVRREAVELFEKGAGYKLTARKLGIKPSTVRDWARQWKKGAFSVKPALGVYHVTDAARQRIRELRAQGANWSEISRRTGVSRTTCRRIWFDA